MEDSFGGFIFMFQEPTQFLQLAIEFLKK